MFLIAMYHNVNCFVPISITDVPPPRGTAGDDRSLPQKSSSTDAQGNIVSLVSSREDSTPDITKKDGEIHDDDSISSDSDSDHQTKVVGVPPGSSTNVYSHTEFVALWRRAEKSMGRSTEAIEGTKVFRAANGKICKSDSDGQLKAQYGRLLLDATSTMLSILEVTRHDVFLDIGHGIGNTCLYASYCIGCESRGIEVVKSLEVPRM
jgi:hypothetical protein